MRLFRRFDLGAMITEMYAGYHRRANTLRCPVDGGAVHLLPPKPNTMVRVRCDGCQRVYFYDATSPLTAASEDRKYTE